MYSLKDISNMTQLTTRTLQNHLKDGLLKGTKIGRSWRFSQEDLKNYLNQNQTQKDLSEKGHEQVDDFLSHHQTEVCTILKFKSEDYVNLEKLPEQLANYIHLSITKDLKTYKASYDEEKNIFEFLLIGSFKVVFQLTQYLYHNLEEGK